MTTKHTPGEWKVGNTYTVRNRQHIPILPNQPNNSNAIVITWPMLGRATAEDYANAAFICKAVNNHDKLVEVLKEMTDAFWGETDYKKDQSMMKKAKSLLASLEDKATA